MQMSTLAVEVASLWAPLLAARPRGWAERGLPALMLREEIAFADFLAPVILEGLEGLERMISRASAWQLLRGASTLTGKTGT